MNKDYDYLWKFLSVGDSYVGKSSLLLRFSDNIFLQNFGPTIGVDFKIRTIELDGSFIKLQIWDTAGQERFRTITASYYKGASGIILVYDITNRQSFKNIEKWVEQVQKYANTNVVKLLIGNKSDINQKRQVSTEEGKAFADNLGITFLQTSAKNADNVDNMFMILTKEVKQKVELKTEVPIKAKQEPKSNIEQKTWVPVKAKQELKSTVEVKKEIPVAKQELKQIKKAEKQPKVFQSLQNELDLCEETIQTFIKQKILTLQTLMLLTQADYIQLKIPMGQRKRLLNAFKK